MWSRLHLVVLPLLAAPLLTPGCGGRVAPEAIPFQFRQSMIDPDDPGEPRVAPPPHRERPRRRASAPRRAAVRIQRSCRSLTGRHYGARPHHEAVAALLRGCLGRDLSLSAIQRDEDLRRSNPRRGDVVFFHNTRDANGNHKLDDRFSDAGVVVNVRGTLVTFIYIRRGRARQGVLNLEAPHERRRGRKARVENTFLRIKLPADPPGTQYLAGQLLAGFSSSGSSGS